ncbi:NAD(P)-dependent oxidoreductase [Pandoraea commovens]|uniref:SDR family oxidoreductase n=1 Tax=Pandoraea commovens TaxID=2508289 RepID=A0ABY5QB73_9BURK|nr:NAD(P)-binding oxidoreductase [Pandoraea commovens]UVA77844.1 SDR family oxidoreductase [Pandoraea commovens]
MTYVHAIGTALVVGATGATGRLLVQQLLTRGWHVRAIVRSGKPLDALAGHAQLSLVQASVLDLSDAALADHVAGCDAVASCLGHNLTLSGIYGEPRRLVTEATRRLCRAIKVSGRASAVRFVLMNTSGNRNRDLFEPVSVAQRCIIGAVRLLLPPHADNEAASDVLRVEIGRDDPAIEWSVVRPDSLVDHVDVTAYEAHPSPIRSALFDAGKTSRINVAHFMADLMTQDDVWCRWRHQMPVLYNVDTPLPGASDLPRSPPTQ